MSFIKIYSKFYNPSNMTFYTKLNQSSLISHLIPQVLGLFVCLLCFLMWKEKVNPWSVLDILQERTGALGTMSGWALLTGQVDSSRQPTALLGASCTLLCERIVSGSFRTAFVRRFQRIKQVCNLFKAVFFKGSNINKSSSIKARCHHFHYTDRIDYLHFLSCKPNLFRIWLCQVISKMWIEYKATGNVFYNSLILRMILKVTNMPQWSVCQATSKRSGFQKSFQSRM